MFCVFLSIYVLIERATYEAKFGLLDWPFWTKMLVSIYYILLSLCTVDGQSKVDQFKTAKQNGNSNSKNWQHFIKSPSIIIVIITFFFN